MSIGAIGGTSAHASQPSLQAAAKAAPKEGGREETTVTTQCDKEHKHTPSCPHTTSTRPAPEAGQRLLDVYA